MNDRNLIRGLFLLAISLAFGLGSLGYTIGEFSHAGPGLFPLMVSSLLLVIAVVTIIRSRFVAPVPMNFNMKNIAVILLSLCGFALISKYVNVIAGVLFMVFCSSFAASSYSVARNLKVAAGLVAIAFAFHKLLGLNLVLY